MSDPPVRRPRECGTENTEWLKKLNHKDFFKLMEAAYVLGGGAGSQDTSQERAIAAIKKIHVVWKGEDGDQKIFGD